MSTKNLVIVESPAKAKTIEKFLGGDFVVKSSFGHIRDLPKKGMSIDIANNFAPTYEISSEKKKTVAELKKLSKAAETVWLASDEDREGEAIAWHLSEALGLKEDKTKRIVFHEITKPAILHAIETPRAVDIDLVNAQQARRVLDRIVGYELSPVLWKKVAPSLSAGRVQSVAVRLIVEKEREIADFDTPNSYKVTALFTLDDGTELPAELPSKLTLDEARKLLEKIRSSEFRVNGIEKTPGSRNPGAPFTTSTLQQEASRRLGYSPKSTMMLAQRLYEAGLITYMRTDSLNLSSLATGQIGEYVKSTFGSEYHQFRKFTTKSAGAQEAHEAIRPTDASKVIAGADEQQKKLYQLIWRRTLGSQMAPAKLEKTTIKVSNSSSSDLLVAKGEMIVFDGFLKLESKRPDDVLLPVLNQGDILKLKTLSAMETKARGPARYSEAALVKKLEEMGIGRPSTYAPTVATIQTRNYVIKGDIEGEKVDFVKLTATPDKDTFEAKVETTVGADKNKLIPTDTGKVVTDFLVKNFPAVIDYDFTKEVEAEFDQVAGGKKEWHKMLSEFYAPFHAVVEKSADISRAEAVQSRQIGIDPKSGKPVSSRYGRFGPMVQIGDKDDDEKPRFAGIPDGLKVETITLEQALKLFELPRNLGQDKEGNDILASLGRFGPYIKIDKRFVNIKGHDPHTIDLKTAIELIKLDDQAKQERIIKQFDNSSIQVLKGRYGPYITDTTSKKNAKIPKDQKPEELTLELCQKLLTEAPVTPKRRFVKKK
jgi:DNA topoisomerase-1